MRVVAEWVSPADDKVKRRDKDAAMHDKADEKCEHVHAQGDDDLLERVHTYYGHCDQREDTQWSKPKERYS